MPVNKKYLKIGVACLAVSALVIGLSVGLTQKNKNNNNAASSNAAYDTYDIGAIDTANEVCFGKSGKSGGGSGKSGKSGGYSMSYEGKSGKSGNRALYVPGILEAYGDDTDASTGKRRKLRHQLLGRELEEPTKSGKSSGDGSTKSGKSGVSSQCWYEGVCLGYGASGKSGKSGSGYGSGKSGKSGGESGGANGSSGKSGKSGGESGSAGSCGKSGKSGGGSGAACPPSPCFDYTVKPLTTEAPPIVASTTFAPAECICEEQPWVWDGAMCVRSCDLTGPGSPSATECCVENTASPDCPINDCGLIPTPSPTEGGTTTVATEKTSAPTQGDRGGV